jgi:hypothetical protein
MIGIAAVSISADTKIIQIELAIAQCGVGVRQSDVSFANGLDLRSPERDSGFELLQNMVIVPSLTILGNYAD